MKFKASVKSIPATVISAIALGPSKAELIGIFWNPHQHTVTLSNNPGPECTALVECPLKESY